MNFYIASFYPSRMERHQQEHDQIVQLLEECPQGLDILKIARCIQVNRNSVAKYLDVLVALGYIEERRAGPSRIFLPSKRIPHSELIEHVSDPVVFLDEQGEPLRANKAFLALFNTTHEHLEEFREVLAKGRVRVRDKEFTTKLLPITLSSGSPGHAVFLYKAF